MSLFSPPFYNMIDAMKHQESQLELAEFSFTVHHHPFTNGQMSSNKPLEEMFSYERKGGRAEHPITR